MSTIIVMPQLGESVAEGIIGKWLKNEGDAIQRDEPIVEVITDKVNAEIPSPVAGVLQRITQPEGATVAVGQEIAVIGDGVAAAPASPEREQVSGVSPAGTSTASRSAAPIGSSGNGHSGGSQPEGAGIGSPAAAGAAGGRHERVRSSPLVRRLADQHGIDLSSVQGTGIGGRVSKHDIMSHLAGSHVGCRQRELAIETPARRCHDRWRAWSEAPVCAGDTADISDGGIQRPNRADFADPQNHRGPHGAEQVHYSARDHHRGSRYDERGAVSRE